MCSSAYVFFRGDADFCMTTCLFLDHSTQLFLWSRSMTMLATKSVQVASNVSKEMFVKLNVKRNLNLSPWGRIWNSLYQIQTMQPNDSTFFTGTESSLYQDCSKYFERVIAAQDIHWNWIKYFLFTHLSCVICLPNTGSQRKPSGPLDSVAPRRPLPFVRADYWFHRNCSIRKQFLQVYREERLFD